LLKTHASRLLKKARMQGRRVNPRAEAYSCGTSERAGSAERRRRAFFSSLLAALAALAGVPIPAAAERWEVTVAVRAEGGGRQQTSLRVALPFPAPTRVVTGVEVTPRGLTERLESTAEASWAEFRGRVRTPRRVAVTYTLESAAVAVTLPVVEPVLDPDPELLPFLTPAPLFQSRSILVRAFLERHAAPAVRDDGRPLFEAILAATRGKLKWRRDGKSLALDVVRRRRGKRIGIERAFVTFLRCARVPARFVEGIDLDSSTRHKRVFWSEVWAAGEWWPVSASRGLVGRLPASWVGLARDGVRVLEVEGPVTASYAVHAYPLPEEAAATRAQEDTR
jgi:hypothetical protein